MTALLIEPHPDDAALFAAFTAHRYGGRESLMLTVLDCGDERSAESEWAARFLGYEHRQLNNPEANPDWEKVADDLRDWLENADYEYVIAPAWEEGGHEHHNGVAIAVNVAVVVNSLSPARNVKVLSYTTYKRGQGRTDRGLRVVPTAAEVLAKMRALACYESQIARPDTLPWFMGSLDEWIA